MALNSTKGIFLICLLFLAACDEGPLNSPYPDDELNQNILYSSFAERPKTLDPAKSYSSNEYQFLAQIYEPPLQYHYLKRPYTLIPQSATSVPRPKYLDKNKKVITGDNPNKVAFTRYVITLKDNILYQPHPAFAKDEKGEFHYHNLDKDYLDNQNIKKLSDFKKTGTRKLTAHDYVYQIKRLAHPGLHSPILGFMKNYIVGLDEHSKRLSQDYKDSSKFKFDNYFDIRDYKIEGVKALSDTQYEILLKGMYPQFKYWLAMPFFSPYPWEADVFYHQHDMDDANITSSWYPVGTGPYMLVENDPNREMILIKNPNFHGEHYPSEGETGDEAKGYLKDKGKPIPFIQKAIYALEKESIPRWNKFLQGYYDLSGISTDSFDEAVSVSNMGAQLTPQMKAKGIRLYTSTGASVFYMGFNWLDPVVGGTSERARHLRQAISIALDYEEYISIFLNGRGIAAQGPIPPGIVGYAKDIKDINHVVYKIKNNTIKRRSLFEAQKLLAKAGYPNGVDKKTGKRLILNYDTPSSSGPDDKARFNWMRKKFSALGIELNIRATQYNRFQEKMRQGYAQLFSWGWHADYPDPENFLFLLYGPNGKVASGGENAANYHNPVFDELFERMKTMPDSKARTALIKKMTDILTNDAPWVWGFHPKNYVLSHDWNRISKPNEFANNSLKYAKINPILREAKRQAWNSPIFWPIGVLLILMILATIPVVVHYRKKIHHARFKQKKGKR